MIGAAFFVGFIGAAFAAGMFAAQARVFNQDTAHLFFGACVVAIVAFATALIGALVG